MAFTAAGETAGRCVFPGRKGKTAGDPGGASLWNEYRSTGYGAADPYVWLLSCLCVALFSVHVEKWKNNWFDKKNRGLIAITVLGFLTQYFFLFYCLLLAAVTAVILLYWHRN